MEHTCHSLKKWTLHAQKKLGWMVLAYAHGNSDKIAMYIESLDLLQAALLDKTNELRAADKKSMADEFLIMHDQIEVLYGFAVLTLWDVEKPLMVADIEKQLASTRSVSTPVHTLCELHRWFKHAFTKYGMIVVGIDRYGKAPSEYIQMLEHLDIALQQKYFSESDKMIKKDLVIMLRQLSLLRAHTAYLQ